MHVSLFARSVRPACAALGVAGVDRCVCDVCDVCVTFGVPCPVHSCPWSCGGCTPLGIGHRSAIRVWILRSSRLGEWVKSSTSLVLTCTCRSASRLLGDPYLRGAFPASAPQPESWAMPPLRVLEGGAG